MKFLLNVTPPAISCRPPRRGAWIEIYTLYRGYKEVNRRPPRRGAWIEICKCGALTRFTMSPPAQGGVD